LQQAAQAAVPLTNSAAVPLPLSNPAAVPLSNPTSGVVQSVANITKTTAPSPNG
jgi:hypothetical protein